MTNNTNAVEEVKKDLMRAVEARRAKKKKVVYREYPTTASTTRAFKPLPSDIIQDPHCWPEWTLNCNYRVIPA